MKEDLTLALFVQHIYISFNDRRLLFKTFGILGRRHRDAYKEVCDSDIPERMMSGRYDEIFNNLYFVKREIYNKYNRKIPSTYALGDAYSVCKRVLSDYSNNTKKCRKGVIVWSLFKKQKRTLEERLFIW